jgi:hypothetical protein
MGKTEKKETQVVTTNREQLDEVVLTDNQAFVSDARAIDLFEKNAGKREIVITSEFLKFGEKDDDHYGTGESFEAILIGHVETAPPPPRTGLVPAVKLIVKTVDEKGKIVPKCYICASTMIVSNLRNLPLMTPVVIEYLGIKDGKVYSYDNFNIKVLA